MGEIYQGAYDAVYQRISGANIGQAVENAFNVQISGLSYAISRIEQDAQIAIAEHQRPSVLFRPVLSLDGNRWCALYGEDLVVGCAGFGTSPAEAMVDFDRAWMTAALTPTTEGR